MRAKLFFLLIVLPAGLALLALSGAPAGEIPPRPPTITPVRGAQIVLVLPDGTAVSPAWWSVVQWQDDDGRWHDVAGWQGTFDAAGRVTWWVGPEHLGTGPFRWVVYESADRRREIGRSAPFAMPDHDLARLEVRPALP